MILGIPHGVNNDNWQFFPVFCKSHGVLKMIFLKNCLSNSGRILTYLKEEEKQVKIVCAKNFGVRNLTNTHCSCWKSSKMSHFLALFFVPTKTQIFNFSAKFQTKNWNMLSFWIGFFKPHKWFFFRGLIDFFSLCSLIIHFSIKVGLIDAANNHWLIIFRSCYSVTTNSRSMEKVKRLVQEINFS